jgi:hypothetical protein
MAARMIADCGLRIELPIGDCGLRSGPVAVAAVVILAACGAERPVETPVAAPEWAPFQAEVRTVTAAADTRGRFVRRRDGSVRRETLGPDAAPAFITIENRATRRFYSFGGGTWTAQPLAPGTSRPARASDFPDAAPASPRDGLRVVRVVTPTGAALLRAPDLDFFPLVEEHPDPPLRIECRVTSRDEPPAPLFEPPAGAPIAMLPWAHTGGASR